MCSEIQIHWTPGENEIYVVVLSTAKTVRFLKEISFLPALQAFFVVSARRP